MHEYLMNQQAHMSSALNGSSVIQCFERSDAIEICDGITFDFYTGLPHIIKFIVSVVDLTKHYPSTAFARVTLQSVCVLCNLGICVILELCSTFSEPS